MAKITCTEHNRFVVDPNGYRPPVLDAPLVEQGPLTAPDATSRLTSVGGVDCKFVRICSDVALHVSYADPATVKSDYYPAGAEIVVPCGQGQRISYLAG